MKKKKASGSGNKVKVVSLRSGIRKFSSPVCDYRNVKGLRRLFLTPNVKIEKTKSVTTPNVNLGPLFEFGKSPLANYDNVEGISNLFSSPFNTPSPVQNVNTTSSRQLRSSKLANRKTSRSSLSSRTKLSEVEDGIEYPKRSLRRKANDSDEICIVSPVKRTPRRTRTAVLEQQQQPQSLGIEMGKRSVLLRQAKVLDDFNEKYEEVEEETPRRSRRGTKVLTEPVITPAKSRRVVKSDLQKIIETEEDLAEEKNKVVKRKTSKRVVEGDGMEQDEEEIMEPTPRRGRRIVEKKIEDEKPKRSGRGKKLKEDEIESSPVPVPVRRTRSTRALKKSSEDEILSSELPPVKKSTRKVGSGSSSSSGKSR
ncbi:hypothetical protein CHUAL_006028 [Chamberlinius hualienensis]